MTLRIFLENLNRFAEENPETLDMEVVTSKDDEGNGFNPVHYAPSKGFFDGGDFISHTQYEGYELDENKTNTVCLN